MSEGQIIQKLLFDEKDVFAEGKKDKTYRAIRHDVVRLKQDVNCNTVHHPVKKILQIRKVLSGFNNGKNLRILELFAGHGNLTKVYSEFGHVTANEKSKKVYQRLIENTSAFSNVDCNNVNSFYDFHTLIARKKVFDVIDLDPYGFPNRFFPDIFMLIDSGVLLITMPKPYVNILNGITAAHLISYYGEQNPSEQKIIEKIVLYGLCHWRRVELISRMDFKSIWRFAFSVEKIKATDYTGVRNR